MRHVFVLSLIFICFSQEVFSQSRPQLKLKYGYIRPLVSPTVKDGYAYRVRNAGQWYTPLSIEFFKPIKGTSSSWFVGLSIESQAVRVELNPANFQSILVNNSLTKGTITNRAYFGWGKDISKKENKSHFHVTGGLGIAFAPSLGGNFREPGSEGTTKNGEHFKTPYKKWIIDSGYVTDIRTHEPFILAPTLHAGIRWQLKNKKGNDAIGIELMGNHGITRYFRYIVSYTLDGIPKEDKFAEKGFCYQLNLLIPLKNFGKKKKQQ